MPEPERPANDESARPDPGAKVPEDNEIPDEDAVDAAATSGEAQVEALRLGAVPYERTKKDEAP